MPDDKSTNNNHLFPLRASQVDPEDDRTEDEKRRARSREVVARIEARRSAVRANGGVIPANPDLHATLESRLQGINRRLMTPVRRPDEAA